MIILRILKDLVVAMTKHGFSSYRQHASTFDEWLANGLADCLHSSPGLASLVATFSLPGLGNFGYYLPDEDELIYDRDHSGVDNLEYFP